MISCQNSFLVTIYDEKPNKFQESIQFSSVFARSGINIGYVNTKTIDKKFAGFEIQIEVKDKQELRQIMQKVRAMKITTSCKRNINEK